MSNNQFVMTQSIKAIDAQIANLQAQIDGLEAQKKVFYQTEEVCIQALNALDKAVAVLHEVAPEQVATFGQFIAAKFVEFATPLAILGQFQLTETEAPAPEVEAPAPEVEAPAPEVEAPAPEIATPTPEVEAATAPAPEVQAEPAPEPEFTVSKMMQSATNVNDGKVQTQTATLTELKAMSIQAIRKLAAKKNVGGSGTRNEIASRLLGLVTTAELKALV